MRVAIIADTHLPRGARRLPARCVELVRSADLLLHAGDITGPEALTEIERIGPPLVAVHGNVDAAELVARLPERLSVDLGGVTVALIHDAGRRRGRLERLRASFPDAAAVVFGHSHVSQHEESDGFQIFNPGSPTERRRAPARTMGIATIASGEIRFEHVLVDEGRRQ
jgi:putative phosphoesterase